MQPFPQPHLGIVQCPHCGACSVPPTALPQGMIVACPTCLRQFVYQAPPPAPVGYALQTPLPLPTYVSQPPPPPITRNLQAPSEDDNSQLLLVVGVACAGLLVAVMLATLLFAYQRNSAPTVGVPNEVVQVPSEASPFLTASESYPPTVFSTPPSVEVAAKQVEEELARLNFAGEPMTLEDLEDIHTARPLTNDMTDAWSTALSELSANGPARNSSTYQAMVSLLNEPAGDLSKRSLEVELMLEKLGGNLDGIITLGLYPGQCRFPFPFDKDPLAPWDDVNNVNYAARLLEGRARIQLMRSQHKDLFDTLMVLFALAHTLDETVGMPPQLVRVGTFEHACQATVEAMGRADFSAEKIDTLAAAVMDFEVPKSALRGLIDTRAIGFAQFDDGPGLLRAVGMGDVALPAKAPDRDRAFYLGFQAKLQDARRAEPWKGLDLMQGLTNDLKVLTTLSPDVRGDYQYSLLLCPADCAAAKATIRTQIIQRTTHAALRAKAFQKRNNRAAATLAECGVTDSDATDPMNGEPLRYRSDSDGMVVYSVGVNRRDDGGRDVDLTKKPDSGVRLRRATGR